MPGFLQRRSSFQLENIAPVYDELTFWASRFGVLLFDNLQPRKHLDILDVGPATGFPLFELAGTFGDSCRVTGLDVWKEALERARLKQQAYNIPNVEIVEGDAAAMPFADARFDLVVSNLGINNFDNPQAALSECYRVLKPGGRLALTTNLKGHWREFYEVFRAVITETGNAQYLERLTANEEHRGTKESVSSLLEGAGFHVTRAVEDSFAMRFADGTALFNYTLTQLGFLDGWRGVVDPADEESVFSELERRLNEISERQGDLRMTTPMLYVEGEK
ncbi:MAG: methyltransferase domain-containing protein [Chloroflexota bacterium]|nr:methyltransferase domain-containing protein [Chloroflexota bacterium]MDQ5865536.1 methyltransferase domain-containing protein [Chloroflexota bacterium]